MLPRSAPTGPRVALIVLGLLFAVVAGTGTAGAHGFLVSSTPPDGATLTAGPDTVVLEFDQSVTLPPDAVVLTSALATVDTVATATDGTVRAVLQQTLAAGRWTVSWRVLAEDGHLQTGSLTIDVVAAPDTTDGNPTEGDPPGGDPPGGDPPETQDAPTTPAATDPDGDGPLVDATPRDGDEVADLASVVLVFDRDVTRVGDGGDVVFRARGHVVATEADLDGRTLTAAPLEPLRAADWVVAWRVVDADGTELRGATTAAVTAGEELPLRAEGLVILDDDGQPVPADDPDAPTGAADGSAAHAAGHEGPDHGAPTTAASLGRGLAAGGAVTGLGLTVFLVGPHRGRTDGRRRLARSGLAGAAVAVAGSATVLALIVADVGAVTDPEVWTTVLGSANGAAVAVRVAGVIGVATLLAAIVRGREVSAPSLAAAAVGAALVLASFGMVGHSVTAGPLARLGTAVHVGAAAVWAGGLMGLLLLRREGPQPATTARFSTWALAAVAAVAAVGVGLSATHLSGPEALVSSGYGRLLVAKVAAVAAAVGVGAWHHLRIAPAVVAGDESASTAMGRTLALEATLVAVVLALTGALVGTAPG